jgi:hypothetical protein
VTNIPEWFKEYLEQLPENRKEQLWRFLDSNPNALDNMIELVGIELGFNCVCEWVKTHKGDIEFSCEFCGIYTASAPHCNKCEKS